MIKQRLTIDKTATGYVLNVDGGNIECSTTAEVMSRVGHEMGMPYLKANRDLFERLKKAEQEASDLCERVRIADELVRIWTKTADELSEQNNMLKQAIVEWFLRAFKEG